MTYSVYIDLQYLQSISCWGPGCLHWMVKCQPKFILLWSQMQQKHNNNTQDGTPQCLDILRWTVSTQQDLQTSGSSSEPSGQSFSRSQRQPLEMQVTPSLHTNCFGLQVFGAEKKQRKLNYFFLILEINSFFCVSDLYSEGLISKWDLLCSESIVAFTGPN